MNDELLLDMVEVARRLRLSKSYVYRLIDERKLACVRIGRRCLCKPEQIQALIDSCTVAASGGPAQGSAGYLSPAARPGNPGRRPS
jgi:excisionase family DNA binding protein